jgi:hypothetical protein
MTQHDQSIGGQGTVDGIAGSRSGTEGATSGQGVDKGAKQKDQSKDEQDLPGLQPAGGLGGNRSDNRHSTDTGVMGTEPRENKK